MVKRSQILRIYDIAHKTGVTCCVAVGAIVGGLTFLRICEILFVPRMKYNIEEDPDFKKIIAQQEAGASSLKN